VYNFNTAVCVVNTDQPDHVQQKSDWLVSLLNHHLLPDKGLAKVNMGMYRSVILVVNRTTADINFAHALYHPIIIQFCPDSLN
jgi:hypothetical protein